MLRRHDSHSRVVRKVNQKSGFFCAFAAANALLDKVNAWMRKEFSSNSHIVEGRLFLGSSIRISSLFLIVA